MLQCGGNNFAEALHLYLLIIWEGEKYPKAWALALLQPIYKGHGKDRANPASYRGIYLMNTLTKLFEGILEARLTPFTELHDTLTPAQHGSRPGRQTHDAIYSGIAVVQENQQRLLPTYACFVDS